MTKVNSLFDVERLSKKMDKSVKKNSGTEVTLQGKRRAKYRPTCPLKQKAKAMYLRMETKTSTTVRSIIISLHMQSDHRTQPLDPGHKNLESVSLTTKKIMYY